MKFSDSRPLPRLPIGCGLSLETFLNAVLMLFLISCVFDPADYLFGAKVWLFVLSWCITIVRVVSSKDRIALPLGLLACTGLFVAIPVMSICLYIFTNPTTDFEGFNLLKGYVLISLSLLLVINRIDILPRLVMVLNILGIMILGTSLAIQIMPELYEEIYVFGKELGLIFLDQRNYGGNFVFEQVYFVTSPMLVISIAWYMLRAQRGQSLVSRIIGAVMVALNVAAMAVAGSRNNLMAAFALPLLLCILGSRHKALVSISAVVFIGIVLILLGDELYFLFDPNEVSNNIKILLLRDYDRFFSNPWTLFLGNGLGAYEWWEARHGYAYISELTYLEMVRNFGLVGALVIFGILLTPIYGAFSSLRYSEERPLAIAWASYLIMCISNPNLFNSLGILILSGLLARMYNRRQQLALDRLVA